jgi:ABC-type ATPase involved in cell division/protein subunit release factor B
MTVRGENAYGSSRPSAASIDSCASRRSTRRTGGHTAFAQVVVAPLLPESDAVEIDEGDLRIDTYRASGAAASTSTRRTPRCGITHLPTGIVVQCQNERSQTSNKQTAMRILRSRLAELQEEEREAELARERGSKVDVGFGSQIRSYVLHPYQMVKDHRTDFEAGNAQGVLDGTLDGFVQAYLLARADRQGVEPTSASRLGAASSLARGGSGRRTRLHWSEPRTGAPRGSRQTLSPGMDDLLITPPDSAAALLEGPDVGTTNGSGQRSASSAAMIVFEDVRKVYDPDVVALDRASFVLDKGEFVFVVGPSGSGKSTIIRLLLKELEPTSGRIIVGWPRPDAAQGARRCRCCAATSAASSRTSSCSATARRSRTSPTRSACRASRMPRSARRCPRCSRSSALRTSRPRVPDELSGGEQQRVSIARAVVNHPPLLICDEPTGNLDPDTSVGIMQLLHRINTAGTTILMVTHDREMVDKMRKRVIALGDGRIVRDERRGGYETE